MSDIEDCRMISLQVFDDGDDGYLSIGENSRQLPFQVRRFYTISRLEHDGAVRGRHAHKKLQQVLFCLRGSAELLLDDGFKVKTLKLSRPDLGVYLPSGIWHELRDFKDGAILLVLASEVYDESDYLRDYEAFRHHVRAHPVS